jgi:hypothetical protein
VLSRLARWAQRVVVMTVMMVLRLQEDHAMMIERGASRHAGT